MEEIEWDNCVKCGESCPLDGAGYCGECLPQDTGLTVGSEENMRNLERQAAAVMLSTIFDTVANLTESVRDSFMVSVWDSLANLLEYACEIAGCECPNCDDPHNGGECIRGFCAGCRESLNDSAAVWGDMCGECD